MRLRRELERVSERLRRGHDRTALCEVNGVINALADRGFRDPA